MRRIWIHKAARSLLLAISVLVAFTTAAALGPPKYDRKTETTVKGTASEIRQKGVPLKGKGLLVVLETEHGPIEIIVGPVKFVERSHFVFRPGELIEVTGSRVEFRGQQVILAREIRNTEKVLELRDSQGESEW